jgi:hypothetical protein
MAYSKASIVVLITTVLATLPAGYGQVFRVQGGTSTLLDAQGGSVDFKAPNYSGNFGLGFYNGSFQIGAVARSQVHGYNLTAGDDSILFDLPTDWFDGTHYFLARGFGVSRIAGNSSFRFFGGTSSTGFSTGFFQAARSDNATALLFYNYRLSSRLRFVSRNVVSKSKTSLQGISWRPARWLEVAASGGLGSDQPYAATGFNIETNKLALRAAYVDTGTRFRRITLMSPLTSEVQKGNIEIAYQPNRIVSLNAGHHNILEPLTPDSPFTPASVNEIGANFHLGRSYFGTGFFKSSVLARVTDGTNLYAGRRITNNIDVTANYFTSQSRGGEKNGIVSGTIRETLSNRISLSQLITRSNGQTTAAFGGDLLTNRLKIRADYQNVYLPYRPDRPFEQALALNFALRLSGPLQVSAGTNVAPDGHLRYTFGISTYLYRERGMWRSTDADSFSFPKYVVLGVVQDPDGAAVEGAAILLGREVVYSDDRGEFMLRLRKPKEVSLKVDLNEFLTAGTFEVLKSPQTAKPQPEEQAQKVEVIVRRLVHKTIDLR